MHYSVELWNTSGVIDVPQKTPVQGKCGRRARVTPVQENVPTEPGETPVQESVAAE